MASFFEKTKQIVHQKLIEPIIHSKSSTEEKARGVSGRVALDGRVADLCFHAYACGSFDLLYIYSVGVTLSCIIREGSHDFCFSGDVLNVE